MREALLMNLKGFTPTQLQETIDEGIASKEETILVGLGVLFEQYYNSLECHNQTKIPAKSQYTVIDHLMVFFYEYIIVLFVLMQ